MLRVEFIDEAKRVRVGDHVVLDLARAVDVDLDIEQVELVLPGGVAGDAPHALVAGGHRDDLGGRSRRGGVKQVEADRPGRGRPDGDRGYAAVPGHAQRTVVGVQIVEHARDLEPGGVDDQALRAGCDGHLALQDVGHERRGPASAAGTWCSRRAAATWPSARPSAGRVDEERDRLAAADLVVGQHQAAVRRVVQGVASSRAWARSST